MRSFHVCPSERWAVGEAAQLDSLSDTLASGIWDSVFCLTKYQSVLDFQSH